VLTVDPTEVEGVVEPLLLETLPSGVPVRRVGALPIRWSRRIGLSAVAVRAYPFLYREGLRLIRRHRPDLVFISTTAFPAMSLGRAWKSRTGVPFVLDMQDPWVPEPQQVHLRRRGLKHLLMKSLHAALEPWTMRRVDGLVSVSAGYLSTLRRRYPWIAPDRCLTLPFGADARDHEIAAQRALPTGLWDAQDGAVHGVYVGRLGPDMVHACAAICAAVRKGLDRRPELYRRLHLHFVGTTYGGDLRTLRFPTTAERLDGRIHEHPGRVPYFAALRLLQESSFLLMPGSVDPDYTASKLYPLVLARKPLLAVLHEGSAAVEMLRAARAGRVVTFRSGGDIGELSDRLSSALTSLLENLPTACPSPDAVLSAHEMTRRQCSFFDRVVAAVRHRRPSGMLNGFGGAR